MSRALSNGRGCRNMSEEKNFFRSLPASPRDHEHFRGITRTPLCGPIEISHGWAFAKSYRSWIPICHFYHVAHYRRIHLLHPSVIVLFFSFRFRREPLNRDGTTADPDSLPRVIIAAGSGLLSQRIVHQLRVTPRVGRSSSRAKIARSARWIGAIGDSDRVLSFEFFRIFTMRYFNKKNENLFSIAN